MNPHLVYRRLYEDLPFRRLQLLQRALASVQRHDDGAMTLASLTREDFGETDALETDSEGIVDHMRAVEGTAVAVLVRELLAQDRHGPAQGEPAGHRRPRGRLPHRPGARRRRPPAGGGLHHRARRWTSWWSGCGTRSPTSSDRRPDTSPSPRASPHTTSWPRCAGRCRAARGWATPGRWIPFATGVLLVLVGRATRAQRWLMGLPKTYRVVARLGWTSDTGDRDGELEETGRVPASPATPGRRPHAGPAGLLGGAGGRGARLSPRAARGGGGAGRLAP